MKILITGSGIHAFRYVQVLMFYNTYDLCVYPDKVTHYVDELYSYGIRVIDSDAFLKELQKADIVIVANEPSNRKEVVGYLGTTGCSAKILFEKPTALSRIEEKTVYSMLKRYQYLVAYSRMFYSEYLHNLTIKAISNSKTVIVKWPNYFMRGINLYSDTLPHVLDLLLIMTDNIGSKPIIIDKTDKRLIFKLQSNNSDFLVDVFPDDTEKELVCVNNILLDWPNYFDYIPKMINSLIEYDEVFVKKNHQASQKINEMMFLLNYDL